jgi:hypothetical protein
VRWRFLDSGRLDAAGQMAMDVGLMQRARESGEAVEEAMGRFDPGNPESMQDLSHEGIAEILSTDHGFDTVREVRRISPEEFGPAS